MTHKPNTFIIGAPKCGTSALAEYLAGHPNVFFSDPKEPQYWCSDHTALRKHLRRESLDDYLRLFRDAHADQHRVIAEGSTRYLSSSTAIPRILEFDPAAKFIVMLRNPVELVHALHMEHALRYDEDITCFEEAWRAQTERAAGKRLPSRCREPLFLQYGRTGRIGEQVQRAMEFIPAPQLQVFIFDDFRADAKSVYESTLGFLDLPPDGRNEFPVVNGARKHRIRWIARLVLDPPKPVEKVVDFTRRYLRKRRYRPVEWLKTQLVQNAERVPMRPEFEAELKEYFAPDVNLVSSLLNRDLMHWVE